MEAAYPEGMVEDFLRLAWELFSSSESTLIDVFEHIWIERAKLPAVLFERCLRSLPEPTSSKWEVMFKVAVKLLPVIVPHDLHEVASHRRTPMLALFLEKCRDVLRGDLNAKGTKVSAAARDKVHFLSGVIAEHQLVGGIYLLVDVWEQSYTSFHKFCKSPSQYGNFDPPHLRHMMAERVMLDTVWYQEALKAPAQHLPRFHKYAATILGDKHSELKRRAVAFLERAQAGLARTPRRRAAAPPRPRP